jgi:hypothetical protein
VEFTFRDFLKGQISLQFRRIRERIGNSILGRNDCIGTLCLNINDIWIGSSLEVIAKLHASAIRLSQVQEKSAVNFVAEFLAIAIKVFDQFGSNDTSAKFSKTVGAKAINGNFSNDNI